MSEPIRVLQVVGTMDLGGAEMFIMNIYHNIDRNKVQFDFLCHNEIQGAFTEEIYRLGGRMYKVDGLSHSGFWGYQKQLETFFLSHPEYEIVHAHQFTLNGLILRNARKAGIKYRYSHSHCSPKKQSIKNFIISSFLKFFITPCNVTRPFACAKAAGDYLYKGILKKNSIVIPNAIDTMKFKFSEEKREKIRKEFGIDKEIVIGHVGRFMPSKNHSFIIDVFNKIVSIESNVKLVLVGDGKLKKEIEEKVRLLKLGKKVFFAGSRNDISDIMSAFDLLFFPSFYEGLSVVCVEAQASGLPIITSTGVSSEICLSDLVKQKSLSESTESWAFDALKMAQGTLKSVRGKYSEIIEAKGFDVKMVAKRMQDIYLHDVGLPDQHF